MALCTLLGLLLIALAQAPSPPPLTTARVDLFTFGPGSDVFSKFGHASLCVFDENGVGGRCFNYGTADFSTPGPLTWDVLRGRARFWVSVTPFGDMIRLYMAEDRTIYRQTLPFDTEQVQEMRQRLETAALPENRYYLYDHFVDNCSTRPRDLIDAVMDGGLRERADSLVASFRELVEENLQNEPSLFLLVQTFVGRSADRKRTEFEAMFLPRVLREAVRSHLGAPAHIVYSRKSALPAPSRFIAHRREFALAVALGMGLLIALGTPSASCVLRWAWGALFGSVGLILLLLAFASPLPELRYNELLLVWPPTDFLLIASSRRVTMLYAGVRLAGLLAVALLLVWGVLLQPLWPSWFLAVSVLGAVAARPLVRPVAVS